MTTQFRFNKIRFGLANLPALFLLGFSIWMFFKLTIEVPIDFHSDFIQIGLVIILKLSPIVFIGMLIPSYNLARQYFKYSSQLVVNIQNDLIEIAATNNCQVHIIRKSDIRKIVSVEPTFKNHRLFSGFSYLVLFDKENTTILPCFVVTKKDFFGCFGNFDNLVESFPYTPSIKPKNYLGKNKIPEFSLLELTDKPIKLSGTQFELLRLLVIAGLAFYTFTAYFLGQTWFIISLAGTLAISLILCLHKKILIADNELIIKHFKSESTYSFNEIDFLDEIQWTTILSLGLSDPMVKMRLTDHNGIHKTIYFFPRKMGYNELKNKLGYK